MFGTQRFSEDSFRRHTYLLCLGFQRLQGVGHCFQLFLKLSTFASSLHKREQEQKIEKEGVEQRERKKKTERTGRLKETE